MERTGAPPRVAHGARGRGGNRRRNDDTRSRASRVHHPRNRRESASAHAQRTRCARPGQTPQWSRLGRAPPTANAIAPRSARTSVTQHAVRGAQSPRRGAHRSRVPRGAGPAARARAGVGHARGARSLRAPRTKPSSSSMSSSWYSVRLTWGTCARGVRKGGRRVQGGRGGRAAQRARARGGRVAKPQWRGRVPSISNALLRQHNPRATLMRAARRPARRAPEKGTENRSRKKSRGSRAAKPRRGPRVRPSRGGQRELARLRPPA